MSLQQKVLVLFNEQFPNATLKQISKKTGIQITRVFRIFNGYEMRISEYEKIEKAVSENGQTKSQSEHLNLYKKYISFLSSNEIQKVEEKYLTKLSYKKFLKPLGYLEIESTKNWGQTNV